MTSTALPTTASRAPALAPVPAAEPGGASAAERGGWTLVGTVLVVWGLRIIDSATTYPWVTAVAVVCIAAGLGSVVASFSASLRGSRAWRVLPWATALVALGAFGVWAFLQVVASPGYGTDEIAFDQYAAHLWVHGLDPYTHSMAAAFPRYHVDPNGYTFHLDGSPVTSLSYPALAFLLYAPLLALGWHSQVAVVVDSLAWAASVLLLFALLPRLARPLAVVLGSLAIFVGYAAGGVTDPLFVPFLIGAAYRWDSFVWARGWRAWRGPVLLGLAMAVKQTPWLVLPFVVVGLAQLAYARGGWAGAARAAARYLAIAAVAFALPNLPFLIQAPGAWVHGVLTPFNGHTIPAGQGLIGLSLYLGLGGGSLTAYALASGLALLALLAVQVATWPRLSRWVFLAPALALFLATRSFGSYFVMLIPAALLAAVTTCAPTRTARVTRAWRWLATGLVAAGAGALLWALGSPPPLQLKILSVRTTGQLATVEQVRVQATNRTARVLHPAFTADEGGAVTAFWDPVAGPAALGAHASAVYTLDAPSFFANPPITGGFQMVAFTDGPPAASHTGAYVPSVLHLILSPAAVNAPVPVGQAVTVTAELVDRYDRPVRRANVPVYLGQIIYAQQGLEYGQAVINGSQPGQTPVRAFTNSAGVATFVIQGTLAKGDPVSFEANLVNAQAFFPYGYSAILDIRFTA